MIFLFQRGKFLPSMLILRGGKPTAGKTILKGICVSQNRLEVQQVDPAKSFGNAPKSAGKFLFYSDICKSGESRRSSWVKIKRINGIRWATSGNFPGLFDDFWSLESSSGVNSTCIFNTFDESSLINSYHVSLSFALVSTSIILV